MNRVVVHYDENGEATFYAEGDVQLLIVDERAPNDRVYECSDRSDASEIDEIIGTDKIGTRFDGSKAAQKLGQIGPN